MTLPSEIRDMSIPDISTRLPAAGIPVRLGFGNEDAAALPELVELRDFSHKWGFSGT